MQLTLYIGYKNVYVHGFLKLETQRSVIHILKDLNLINVSAIIHIRSDYNCYIFYVYI